LYGGRAGTLNKIELFYPDGCVYSPKTKEIVKGIPKGTIVHQIAGGGGGYGDPFKRPVEKVLKDVQNGFVSIEKAKIDHGVVVDPLTMRVDKEETRKLRNLK
jgi:N-methylhydantoinase B